MNWKHKTGEVTRELDKLHVNVHETNKTLWLAHYRFDDMMEAIGNKYWFRLILMIVINISLVLLIIFF